MKTAAISLITTLIAFISLGQDIKGISIEIEQQTTGINYTTNVKLYSDAQNIVPRPFLVINNGIMNDTLDLVLTSELSSNLLLRTYRGQSLYPGPGFYNVALIEGFRIDDIDNIVNSGNTSLFKNFELLISSGVPNNEHPLIDGLHSEINHNNGTFSYQPMIVDSDSIFVKLVDCTEQGYTLPEGAVINHATGDLSITPSLPGKYAVCIEIEEWKNGDPMSKTVEEILFDTDAIVGTNEIQDLTLFNIYPNPSSGQLSVDLDIPNGQDMSIELYDYSGKLISQLYSGYVRRGTSTMQLPIEFVQSGFYIIQLRIANMITSTKFIKI